MTGSPFSDERRGRQRVTTAQAAVIHASAPPVRSLHPLQPSGPAPSRGSWSPARSRSGGVSLEHGIGRMLNQGYRSAQVERQLRPLNPGLPQSIIRRQVRAAQNPVSRTDKTAALPKTASVAVSAGLASLHSTPIRPAPRVGDGSWAGTPSSSGVGRKLEWLRSKTLERAVMAAAIPALGDEGVHEAHLRVWNAFGLLTREQLDSRSDGHLERLAPTHVRRGSSP